MLAIFGFSLALGRVYCKEIQFVCGIMPPWGFICNVLTSFLEGSKLSCHIYWPVLIFQSIIDSPGNLPGCLSTLFTSFGLIAA